MVYAYELAYVPVERNGVSTATLRDWLARLDSSLLELARGRKPRVNELRRTLREERENIAGELAARYAADAPQASDAWAEARRFGVFRDGWQARHG